MNDSAYWANFYNNKFNNIEQSDFCKYVLNYIEDKNIKKILDCGCGNGRDSYSFSNKYQVTGIDNSSFVPKHNDTCQFINDDFCTYNKYSYDLIYSRFTFHSITNEQHRIFLKSIETPGTLLCIETRSDKGTSDIRYHGDTHYRNFTNIDYISDLLKEYNFDIKYIEENKDFSIYKDENPICIRIICQKK